MFPHWRLSHARGYLILGLIDEAADELAQLPDEWLDKDDTLALRAAILQEQKDWLQLQALASDLARRMPGTAEWWIMWAYATRRAESLPAAQSILREAELQHPTEATIQFNLACYACQLGDLEAARQRLAHAISLDKSFASSALSDPDLAPLRATGWRP
jgi:tetratricopeptide (TPR) repeat protein